jgi:alpha-ribazole phosphatase
MRIAADPAFAGCRRVWSSPARRCLAVAEAVATNLGCEPSIDPQLRELDFGAWEGLPWVDVARADLDRWAAAPLDFAPPGGETGKALLDRVAVFHRKLIGQNADTVVISHGGPLKLLAALLEGRLPDLLSPAPPIGSIQTIVT